MFNTTIAAFTTAMMFSCAVAFAEDSEHFVAPHITVSGSSYADLRPDLATLRLGIITEKPTAGEAESENSNLSASIIAAVKSLGIEPKNIRTSSLTLSPVMIEERDAKTNGVIKRTLTAYRASNYIDVQFRDVDKAGAIASRVVEQGANTYQSLSFQVSNYDYLSDQQRAKAVAVAMRRATLFASGASMKLGRLLAINPEPDQNDGAEADLLSRQSDLRPHVVVIPIEPGTVRVGARVNATWELFPE